MMLVQVPKSLLGLWTFFPGKTAYQFVPSTQQKRRMKLPRYTVLLLPVQFAATSLIAGDRSHVKVQQRCS